MNSHRLIFSRRWLHDHGLRVTRHRLALVEVWSRIKEPISLADLHARVKELPCDFATVFRFVEVLETKGLVLRHYWGDRQPYYEFLGNKAPGESEPEGHLHRHHHHLVCRICRRIEAIDRCAVEAMERQLERTHGYTAMSHTLEFFGVCPGCRHVAEAES